MGSRRDLGCWDTPYLECRPFLTQSRGAASFQASPRGQAQFPFLLNKKSNPGKNPIWVFILMPPACHSHPAIYTRGSQCYQLFRESTADWGLPTISLRYFYSLSLFIHWPYLEPLVYVKSCVRFWTSGDKAVSFSGSSLQGFLPTAAFRETQDVTVLLSVGGRAQRRWGPPCSFSFTSAFLKKLRPT